VCLILFIVICFVFVFVLCDVFAAMQLKKLKSKNIVEILHYTSCVSLYMNNNYYYNNYNNRNVWYR